MNGDGCLQDRTETRRPRPPATVRRVEKGLVKFPLGTLVGELVLCHSIALFSSCRRLTRPSGAREASAACSS